MSKQQIHEQGERSSHLLDTPILQVLNLNLETLLYILLGLIAIVACFYNLGARTQSHDESLHALYSWKLYAGEGYEHNPMMHGPFLFHINALMYFLFGVSDFTARISAALFGVILVLLPAFFRRQLGRIGALIVSTLTLISPTTLYYARYIRNDIYMMVWALLMAIALFRYLNSRKPGWLYLGAVAVILALCTKETAYITGFIGFTFVVMLFIQHMLSPKSKRAVYTIGIVIAIVFVLGYAALSISMNSLPVADPEAETAQGFTQQTAAKIQEVLFLLIGILVTMMLGMLLIKRNEALRPALSLIVAYVLAILSMAVFAAGAGGAAWLLVAQLPAGILQPPLFLALQVIAVALAVGGASYGWWILFRQARAKRWIPATFSERALYITIAIVVVLFTLLYTTFFTNPKGLGSGTFGAIGYWLAQQEVKRAGQPWFYYLIIAPLYEFLPIGVGLIALFYYLVTGKVDRSVEAGALPDERPGSSSFVAYLVYWTLSAWLIYSWAGEKMPWMLVHVVQPMVVLTGRFADDILHRTDWRRIWRQGGALLALIIPVMLFAAAMIVGLLLFGQALEGVSLQDLNATSQWLAALIIGAGLAYAAWQLGKRLGQKDSWRVVFVSFMIVGALFTVRYAVMASFINYDTAKEFLVYAHGGPDVKRTVEELQKISRRLYGDEHSIKFAYTSDATWPFEWYFDTLFPNRVFIGREPTRQNTDVPVLVIGRDEIAKTEPLLGNRYYRYDRKLVWWPHQDYYMGLSLAMPREENREFGKNYFLLDMQDPEKRRAFWNVLFYRKYEQSLADWEPSHPFAFYIRKDIAARLWDFGAAPASLPEEAATGRDLYDQMTRVLNTIAVWGGQGGAEGMFNAPRNVAIAPDGSVYVADGGNHRIQKFTAEGTFVTTWGHQCKMYESMEGCQAADGAGGFYDPWGIAVDADGFVYVADTWNHRIQKFTADGEFVTMWGSYGVSESAAGAVGMFWGPRDIAIGQDNLIYVTDTGNKRIQAFTPDGEYVAQWGGKGTLEGNFDEPVGIAVGTDGRIFVTDTWNQRIQVFDPDRFFRQQWDILTWPGNSLENKPYIALDAQNRVYATDPEGYRILVFDEQGEFLTSIGQYGSDDESFMLPTGIAIDTQGYIWVADPATHRVLKLAPLE